MKTFTTIFFFLIIISIHSQDFKSVERVINSAIQDSIFPGATILIGDENSILYKNAHGNFTYDSTSKRVENNTIFDLASVTKAFATTLSAMKLVDEGKLDIEKPVAFYLPKFATNDKENVKVVDLLVHQSGLQAYYSPMENETRDDILNKIKGFELSYKTGEKTLYSCLNLIVTMMVIEAIINKPMYQYYSDNFSTPLELSRTMFTPTEKIKSEIIPTSPSLQGVVHDPLARGLEGLSGNAGLFSTTSNLSKLSQLLLNKGVYNNIRYLSEDVVSYFTKEFSPGKGRAIGFDIRSEDGTASSGKYFNKGAYGHLGYTGTSLWIDPVRKIYVIFLTNRVYPNDEASIRSTRPKVHDAVMKSLDVK